MWGPMFIGHALPGAFLILIALWWLLRFGSLLRQRLDPSAKRYVSAESRQLGFHFLSQLSRPTAKGVPVISFLLIVLPFILSGRELYVSGWVIYDNTSEHITTYFSIAIMSFADICVWLSLRYAPLRMIPSQLSSLGSAVTMAVIGLLFSFHLYGRPPLDVRVHTIFYYNAYALVLVHLVEMFVQRNILLVFLRIYGYIQIGVFLIAMGAMLEDWELTYENAGKASIMFASMLMVNLVLLTAATVGSYYLAPLSARLDPKSWTESQDVTGKPVEMDEFGLLADGSTTDQEMSASN